MFVLFTKVTEDNCKIVFTDPDLKICDSDSNIELFEDFPGDSIYIWGGASVKCMCDYIPDCFCEACAI